MRAAAIVLGASCLCAASLPAATTAEHAPTLSRALLRFDQQLGLRDIRFSRASESRRIVFAVEAAWKPRAGSEMRLIVEHAPGLDGSRSFLFVRLNGGVLRSLRLDEANAKPTEVVIPLPPSMLQRSNEVLLGVEQYGHGDTVATGPWTAVRSTSFISVEHDAASVVTLRDWPLPLVDPLSYRPHEVAVLMPVRAAPETLESAGRVVARLAAIVAPKSLHITAARSPADGAAPLLVIGTPSEQPSVAGLLAGRGFMVDPGSADGLRGADGRPLAATDGLAGVRRDGEPWSRGVLFVTAPSPEGVRRAADALFDQAPGLGTAAAILSPATPPRMPAPREWKDTAPARSRFTLAHLGYDDQDLVLSGDAPLSIAVRTTPDTRFLANAHRVTLSVLRQPELSQDPGARLEVAWNDVSLTSIAANRPGPPTLSATIDIPVALLRHDNVLTLRISGAKATPPRTRLAAVSSESAFYLPRAYAARLPDLALLDDSLFPFSLLGDLSDVIVVVPEGAAGDVFALVCELSALLGRLAPSDRPAFRVQRPARLTAAEKAGAHLVVLEVDGQAPLVPAPALDWKRLSGGPGLRRLPMLQQLVSPWNDRRFVLRLRAGSLSGLTQAVRDLGQPGVLARVAGDTAFLTPRGPVSYRAAATQAFDEVSYLTLADAWLQTHSLALPVGAASVSAGLFFALRRALRHYVTAYRTSSSGASWRP